MKILWKRFAWSPGKVILFGEHAVVYGHPAVSMAIDLATTVATTATDSRESSLEGSAEAFSRVPYLVEAARMMDVSGVDVSVRSALPRSSGLGSSAAVTSGFMATLLGADGALDTAALAKKSFVAELAAQKVGSPVDTSTVCAGGLVTVGGKGYGKNLWEIPSVGERGPWKVDRLPDPGWSWVIAYTGIPKQTGPVVSAVGRKLAEGGSGTLKAIARTTEEGIAALFKADRAETGHLMNLNNDLLFELGVGNARIREIVDAVGGRALGVKITGAGLGGSLVALPKAGEEPMVARLFSQAGTLPFIVNPAKRGVVIS